MTKNRQKEKIELAEIERRLKVLLLADKLGSVVDACKQMDFSRTQYYFYKKRYDELGMEGLRPAPYTPRNHPQTTPEPIKERIKEISLNDPFIGAQRISEILKDEGVILSSASVHKILDDNALSKRRARWIFLENLYLVDNDMLSEHQFGFLTKMNPCHGEKNNIGTKPGDLLVQDFIKIYSDEHLGNVYLHFVVDTFSNVVFGKLARNIEPGSAMKLLQTEVLPFYKQIAISRIKTHNGRTFAGNEKHDYQMFLRSNQIKHVYYEGESAKQKNGFSDRFDFICDNEYILELNTLIKNFKQQVTFAAIENHFENWLKYYNNSRGHFGFPNYSSIPMHKHQDWIKANSAHTA